MSDSTCLQPLKVCIIGGGIAGPAAAIALLRLGCDVTLLESRTEADCAATAGSYFTVQPNGVYALQSLGLAHQLVNLKVADANKSEADAATESSAIGFEAVDIRLFNHQGTLLGAVPCESKIDGIRGVTMKRWALSHLLLQHLQQYQTGALAKKDSSALGPVGTGKLEIIFGVQIDKLTEGESGVCVYFQVGGKDSSSEGTESKKEKVEEAKPTFFMPSIRTADVLIGADGINSRVRKFIDPKAPDGRYVGLVNFGGFTPNAHVDDSTGTVVFTARTQSHAEEARAGSTAASSSAKAKSIFTSRGWNMIFGYTAFFGFQEDPIRQGIAWFVNWPSKNPVGQRPREEWDSVLATAFANDIGPVRQLLSGGFLEYWGGNTCDLPHVPVWNRGRCVIIGDAAHCPSPSSGQGASMALEDAIVLANCLHSRLGQALYSCAGGMKQRQQLVEQALTDFVAVRRKRVETIVAEGARSSSAKAAGPVGRFFRDLMMPQLFKYLAKRSSNPTIDYRVPLASATSGGGSPAGVATPPAASEIPPEEKPSSATRRWGLIAGAAGATALAVALVKRSS